MKKQEQRESFKKSLITVIKDFKNDIQRNIVACTDEYYLGYIIGMLRLSEQLQIISTEEKKAIEKLTLEEQENFLNTFK